MAYFRGTSLLIRKVSEVISQLADFKFWGKKGASSLDVLYMHFSQLAIEPPVLVSSISHTHVRLKLSLYQGGRDKFTLAPAHSTLLSGLLNNLHVKNNSLWKVFKD